MIEALVHAVGGSALGEDRCEAAAASFRSWSASATPA
jgi:hypothetical protein